MRLNRTGKIVVIVVALVLLYAWIDGGRVEQRPIVQPVTYSESTR